MMGDGVGRAASWALNLHRTCHPTPYTQARPSPMKEHEAVRASEHGKISKYLDSLVPSR